MSPFAGDGIGAREDVAAKDDSATAPGAENDSEDNLGIAAGAVAGFGKREAVGIVGQADLTLQERLEVGAQRLPNQTRRVGVLDQSAGQ